MQQRLLGGISSSMKRIFDSSDRIRLRERFFGATHAVLART
ncbi:hypothetical protein Z945_560 [Sulfitobacter noctilucae]|nr:hypothetical protein Z945_560 [Sulfitobacter noctilucae]